MNKLLLSTLAIVGLFSSAVPAPCQRPTPQIDVTGTGEIRVAPNEVDLSAGVETRDAQLSVATHQNDERVAMALAFLRQAGVPDKDIQTDAIE